MDFEEYCGTLGLAEYPFSLYTSEGESHFLDRSFVQPEGYSVVLNSLKNSSALVVGERGTGKTALSLILQSKLTHPDNLIVRIEEFSDLELSYTSPDFYRFLLSRILGEFFTIYADTPHKLWKLSKEDRRDLSFLLHEYVGGSTKSQLIDRIKRIQNGITKRTAIGFYNFFRGLLNYGVGALTKAINESLASHFPALPRIEEKDIDYFRRLDVEVDIGFRRDQREYRYLETFSRIARQMGLKHIYVFIDKVDEDPRLSNDAEDVADFLRTALQDNKVLASNLFNTAFFVWSTPFNYLQSDIRTQKLSVVHLRWSHKQLATALTRRLSAFSKAGFENIKASDIFSDPRDMEQLFGMANGNLRDLWHIIDKCFKAQFAIDPNFPIGTMAIEEGLRMFVTSFNFYEYYPRKSNARANSMDVYKYVLHLQKLSSSEFTKDQFNSETGSGSSTNNYVVAMENMGLITRTEKKGQNGAVIYQIHDPKVRYAIQHGISIK